MNSTTVQHTIPLGDIIVKIMIITSNKPGVNFLNVHQNEKTSIEAATYILQRCGGRIVHILHGDGTTRNIHFTLKGIKYEFDPNRMFSNVGAESSLKMFGKFSKEALNEVRKLGNAVLKHSLPNRRNYHIVALHNNYNKKYSFKSYFSKPLSEDVLKIYPLMYTNATGEFFYVTNNRWFEALKRKHVYNVVLQNNRKVKDDGSLSVYAGKRGIPYANVEAEHGHLSAQEQMLKEMQNLILPCNRI